MTDFKTRASFAFALAAAIFAVAAAVDYFAPIRYRAEAVVTLEGQSRNPALALMASLSAPIRLKDALFGSRPELAENGDIDTIDGRNFHVAYSSEDPKLAVSITNALAEQTSLLLPALVESAAPSSTPLRARVTEGARASDPTATNRRWFLLSGALIGIGSGILFLLWPQGARQRALAMGQHSPRQTPKHQRRGVREAIYLPRPVPLALPGPRVARKFEMPSDDDDPRIEVHEMSVEAAAELKRTLIMGSSIELPSRSARSVDDSIVCHDMTDGWAPDAHLGVEAQRELARQLARVDAEGCLVIGVYGSTQDRRQKSRTAAALALALAELGDQKVLLMEGDFNQPRVARWMRVSMPATSGLSRQLQTRAFGATSSWEVLRCTFSLDVLCEGPMRTPGAILTLQFDEALRAFRQHYRYILVDGPTLGDRADFRALATLVDGTILVRGRETVSPDSFERTDPKLLYTVVDAA